MKWSSKSGLQKYKLQVFWGWKNCLLILYAVIEFDSDKLNDLSRWKAVGLIKVLCFEEIKAGCLYIRWLHIFHIESLLKCRLLLFGLFTGQSTKFLNEFCNQMVPILQWFWWKWEPLHKFTQLLFWAQNQGNLKRLLC